jgi:alanine-synthesizing transaminase
MIEITPLERARRARESREGYIDLVASDFRAAGLHLPEELYRHAWKLWRTAPSYTPDARGHETARAAVAAFLTDDGLPTEKDQICLTAGSSISYSLIFRVLRERRYQRARGSRGSNTVALPTPGYPLFEELVRDAGLVPVAYDLPLDTGCSLDGAAIRTVLSKRPLALILISPNNPAGTIYNDRAIEELVRLCADREVAVISDEVFSAFRPADSTLPRPASVVMESSLSPALVFSLNGLSKLCAAPEIKVGWIAVHGPSAEVADAIEALEMAHDTYLTVSGYAEAACRTFLSHSASKDRLLLAEGVRTRREIVLSELAQVPGVTAVGYGTTQQGGIHMILRFDADLCSRSFGTADDADIAEVLVRTWGVYLHPGYLYGIDADAAGSINPCAVITCLNRPETLREGIRRLGRALRE